MKSTNENELNDLNAKLKKTISERDLLIREYKAIKEKSGKMEETINNSKAEAEATAATHKKELKKLQDQVTALENTSKTSGKGDKEKDKLIGVSEKTDYIYTILKPDYLILQLLYRT